MTQWCVQLTRGVALWGSIPRSQIGREEVAAEIERFESALEKSAREIGGAPKQSQDALGDVESGIFEAHLSLLRDPEFVRRIKQRV